MTRREPFLSAAALAGALVATLAARARAADTVPLRTVGNALVLRVNFHGKAGDFPAHLILDLGMKQALLLQDNVAGGLADGHNPRLDLSLCDTADKSAQRLTGLLTYTKQDIDAAQQLTRESAAALKEIPVIGFIGLGAFGDRTIEIDPSAGTLRLDAPPDPPLPTDLNGTYTPVDAGLKLAPANAAAGAPRLMLATRQFETLALDQLVTTHALGTDHATPIPFGPFDLSRYSALRPFTPPRGMTVTHDAVLGVQAVSCFRVTLDLAKHTIRLRPTREPPPMADEQAALIAIQDKRAADVEAFARAHPTSWLWHEAASTAFKMRLDDAACPDDVADASLELYAQTLAEPERAKSLLAMADALQTADAKRYAHVIAAAIAVAGRSTGKDLDGTAVFTAHAMQGVLALEAGDLPQARRHLLSAAFGLPKDAKVHLYLGRLYEKLHQPARAWSQYMTATLCDRPPDDAIARLNFLTGNAAFRQTFHAAEAELLLEGNVPSFAPARDRPADQQPAVKLVEFFADADNKAAVAPQLAFDGLRTYFADTPLVLLAWHGDAALATDVAKDRRAFYGNAASGTLVADGIALPADKNAAAAAATQFDAWLPHLIAVPPAPVASIDPTLWITSTGRTARVHAGALPVDPASRLHVLLVERCVIAPTAAGLPLHYAVVRRCLTPAQGRPLDGTAADFAVDLDAVPVDAADNLDASLAKATYIDPRELSVIAIVQDATTHAVRGVTTIPFDPGGRP